MTEIPKTGFLRIWDIIGDKRKGIIGVYPVGRTAWYEGIREGRYPAPIKLSSRSSAWRCEDIRNLIAATGGGTEGLESGWRPEPTAVPGR